MLIDVHAHFYTSACNRLDWERLNTRRLEAGATMGITFHVASILGSYGYRSPTYFPSPEDVAHANRAMVELQEAFPRSVRGYCLVNPNYTEHALQELGEGVARGMVGVKLAASRRANDPLLDPIAEFAARHEVPILHHIWQHRQRDWPGQEASDATELAQLASRHPRAKFILAHLGGGGNWAPSIAVLEDATNIWVDLSGSGCDVDMIDIALQRLGPDRLLWGCDLTMGIGWGKLRYIEALGLSQGAIEAVKWKNAAGIFPDGAFDAD